MSDEERHVGRRPWRDALSSALGNAVAFDVPMAPRVSFRIGGLADALVVAASEDVLQTAVEFAERFGLPVTILGGGTNVLVSDRGIRGVSIQLAGSFRSIEVVARDPERSTLRIGAAARNAQLAAYALRRSLVGIEFLATIPGTIGGALIMNAGAHGHAIGSRVKTVRVLRPDRSFEDRDAARCGFAYRASAFGRGEVVVGAVLEIESGDGAVARDRLRAMRASRRRTQPTKEPSAGSIFRNPTGDHAGRLIDACGLKGCRRGNARISEIHANFIVNEGGAKAADVVALANEARRSVRERFGVELEWEVRRVGDFLEDDEA